ncbi:MAG: oxidoreductase [Bradyrhizobium sp.]|nr:oxidoreductase [Bradyrhizobium sp.]
MRCKLHPDCAAACAIMGVMSRLLRLSLFAALPALLLAQPPIDWHTATDLPGVDMTGLTAQQKTAALKILRDQGCSCGCAMKMAQCRVLDPGCAFSTGLAKVVIKGVREGKTEDQVMADVKASPLAKGPAQRPLLEDPVKIPIAGAPSKGPEHARITLVEFSDFECPYCSRAVSQVDALMVAFPRDIRLVYKQFPLSTHPHARMAAVAALAANEQGKFWEMHDKLFANYHQLSRERILALAKEIGLDVNRFTADVASGKFDPVVAKDFKDGEDAGVNGTPAFFINGKHYNGPMALDMVKPLIEAELKPVTASK